MNVYNINKLLHHQLSSDNGEIYSKSALITEILAFKDLFVHHEILAPGKKSSAPHRHTHREEIFLILEGSPTIHLGESKKQLYPGDFVGFQPDVKKLHFLENNTETEVRLLVICSNPLSDRVLYIDGAPDRI